MPDEPRPLSPKEVDALEQRRPEEWWAIPKAIALQLFATVRDRERQRDILTEEYRITRETCRSFLTEEQNAKYPTTLDKLQFLGAERDELQRQLDATQRALRLTDAMLSHRQECPTSHQPPERCDCGIEDTKSANAGLLKKAELRRIMEGK
jgi:hypothetical protein